jgi:hypothetical protein
MSNPEITIESLQEEIRILKAENHNLKSCLVQLSHQEFLLFRRLERERCLRRGRRNIKWN